MLHCPCCHRQHQTLRTLLTCCPRELRRITDLLDTDRKLVSGYTLTEMLCGMPLPPRIRQALITTPQEVAA